ncbi:potassium voltage-gated channel subfamily c member 2 [Plakobranchus ocellatus]|uniref:Potassium voltage-gated channel subfamily c member 2 n=1 Tax=Plakobranchus ocellatus TaxID=259542 RepID=A0AAV4D664_9GAST|nr:potassium voltage-gated channel subfamily c member 2 [Plakobranchus ocellatus]
MSRSVSLAPKISLAPGAKTNNRITLNVGGKLHAPTDVCGPLFEEELAFWGIDEKQIEPCCWPTYRAHRDAQETLADFDNDNDDDDEDDGYDEDEIARRFGIFNEATKTEKSWFERWRPRIWTLLEEPYSSRAATVVTMCTSLFVILSIATYCAETHHLFRYTKNNTSLTGMPTVRQTQRQTEPYLFLVVLEGTCMAFFTIDIIVRIIFSPDKKEHLLQAQTFFDVMSVLPFYIRSLVVAIDPDSSTSDGLYFLNSLRLILIFRILKLTRYFSGFKILGHTLKASAKELLLMILVLSIGVLVFACLIYYAEQLDEDSLNDFRNIPRGFWWAVVTMTTLGYGDMFPRTALGYIVGAVCALCGLLMLALPVPVIVSNFTLYYTHAQAKLKLPKKTRNTLVGAADALKASMSDLESQRASTRDSLSSVTSFDSKPGLTTRETERTILSQQMQEEPGTHVGKSVETNEEECSVDSGFKAWSPQDERRSATGISVIFTDESRESSVTPRASISPRRGGNLRASAKRQRLSLCGPHRMSKITINCNRDREGGRATKLQRGFSVEGKVQRTSAFKSGGEDGGEIQSAEAAGFIREQQQEEALGKAGRGLRSDLSAENDTREKPGNENWGGKEGEEERRGGEGGEGEGGGGGKGGEAEEATGGVMRRQETEMTATDKCRGDILENKTNCAQTTDIFTNDSQISGETNVNEAESGLSLRGCTYVQNSLPDTSQQHQQQKHHFYQHQHHHHPNHHQVQHTHLGGVPGHLHNGVKGKISRESKDKIFVF